MDIKSLTIYCSSSNLLEQKYYDLSNQIGEFLGNKKISIIYGGGKVGMMGKISHSAMSSHGRVIGIIPKFLNSKEIIDLNVSETIIVKDMRERKQKLFELGDAFLILPGGSGTIEEATEIISWFYLGLHNKPIIIINFENYWDSMLQMYDNVIKKNFGEKKLQPMLKIVKTFEEFSNLF
jgi:hypothetical protein|tara:strand:+ start:311 stop:847 length:537 start_codon:yes stop_codon:yes gene_type:complete